MNARLACLLTGLLLAACGQSAKNKPHLHDNQAGANAGGAEAGGAANAGGETANDCPSTTDLPPATLVRLTFPELSVSLATLLGDNAAQPIDEELELSSADDYFPPLAAPGEGTVVTDTIFQRGDLLAQRASTYVLEHFAAVTGCAQDYGCVSDFVDAFAEQAFRRALNDEEQSALDLVVQGAEALGAPPEQAAQYGVYAVLESPHFLYRSELGPAAAAAAGGEVRLSDDELASALSFFLTGAPPDAPLLAAAAARDLGGSEQLAPHVDRLLASPAAKTHLQRTLGNYLGIARLRSVIIDPALYPAFNAALASSMEVEVQALLEQSLWSGPVAGLLTTRTAQVNDSLATLYGVAFPPAGAKLDELGFAKVELPEERAGLFTRAGILSARSRPDGASVVGRGLWVQSLVCDQPPSLPNPIPDESASPNKPNPTERERSEYRQETDTCKDCHLGIDPYGLALDEFDAIGRYRSEDAQGRPIDTTVTLPQAVGGGEVTGGAGLSTALAGGPFTKCLAQRFVQYAVPAALQGDSSRRCEAQALADAGELPADVSFAELLKSVALSRTFANRQR